MEIEGKRQIMDEKWELNLLWIWESRGKSWNETRDRKSKVYFPSEGIISNI